MEPRSGRLIFTIGEAFPLDSPVAVFLVATSTALNDLVTASKWLVGGDNEEPNRVAISDVERVGARNSVTSLTCEFAVSGSVPTTGVPYLEVCLLRLQRLMRS
jgi:hypothetical protein